MRRSKSSPSARRCAGSLMAMAALAACLLAACGEPAAETPSNAGLVDLVSSFGDAQVELPTHHLDIGQAEAWTSLVAGWHPKSRALGQAGKRAAWTRGDRAAVDLFVPAVRDLELTFRCSPAVPPEGAVRLILRVGREKVFDQKLKSGWGKYTATIPASQLTVGSNRLIIEHEGDYDRNPIKDIRVLWDFIALDVPEISAPKADSENGTLSLPAGSRMSLYLDLPADAVLFADELRLRGDGAALRVVWEPLEGTGIEQQVERAEALEVLLTNAEPGRGRLSLFALGTPGKAQATLIRPRVDANLVTTPASTSSTAAASESESSLIGDRPDIVVYMIDTLRSDHLGSYGYERDTSPILDRFAEEAVLFENSQAQTPWTRASVASVLTGLWSQVHGALDDPDTLADELVTLPERLRDAGYQTAAIVGNGNASGGFGFAQGFDHFEYLQKITPDQLLARGTDINAAVDAWLEDKRDPDKPLFLWVHTIDPHAPYHAPEPFHSRFSDQPIDPDFGSIAHLAKLSLQAEDVPRETLDRLIDLYDAEIAANDASFGDLMDNLRRRGLYDDSVIMVLSDHGEEFFEHGDFQHGKTLYSEQLDTPLIIKVPGLEGGIRRTEVVEHIDVMPTLLELAGLEPAEKIQGVSLVPLLGTAEVDWDDTAIAHVDLRGNIGSSAVDRSGRWKAIVTQRDGVESFPELFDRIEDPRETTDRGAELESRARYLATRLRHQVAGVSRLYEGEEAEMSEETRRQLEALGYL